MTGKKSAGLCKPLDPFVQHGIVYQKQYGTRGLSIALRPLLLPADLPVVRSWVMREYLKPSLKGDLALNLIVQTLLDEARSDKAQVITVLLGNKPVCEMELAHAQQDELSHYYKTKPGDYVIRFLSPFHKTTAVFGAIVQTCRDYLLQHTEVKRILAPLGEKNSSETRLIEKAGFNLIDKITARYKKLNLYASER